MSIDANPSRPFAMPPKSLSSTRLRGATLVSPALLLFLSGIAALIFQTVWIKQLTLVVGVEVHAIAAAVSAFFGGLALGGLCFGRLADRMRRPLGLYGVLEIGSAVFALGTTLVLGSFAPIFVDVESRIGELPAWGMVFVIVALPAILMGGTLPAMVAAVRGDVVSRLGGRLYAANTAGAILGALAPAFLLIPALGVRGTACAAAALYLAVGIAALALDRAGRLPARSSRPEVRAAGTPLTAKAWAAIALYTVAGAVALGYEIVWSQAIVQFMSTRAFAFSIVLATYLAGLALGAAALARVTPRMKDPSAWFGCLIAGAGLLALLTITLLGPWLPYAQSFAEALVYRATLSEFAAMCARFAVASVCVVLPATLLLGAALPVLLALVVDRDEAGRDQAGRGVGLAVGLNTLGGIVGSLVTGFALIPGLGLVRTLSLLALLAVTVGIAALFLGRGSKTARLAVAGLAMAVVAAAVLTPRDRLADLLPGGRGGALTFYEESQGGTVAVIERGEGDHRFRRLYIQGVSNSGDAMPSLRYMRLQALLPLIIHTGEPKSALVIGYGTGITVGALSRFPGLEKRVVAELLPAVLRAGPQFTGTYGASSDDGLEVRLRDGRRELQASDEHYDLITLEPPPPSAAGIVNLYSRDFYRLAGARLNRNGMVAQWLPLPTQNEDDTRALVKSFTDVFPYALLWTTELHETLLVGSYDPITLDLPTIRGRLSDPKMAAALSEVGVDSAAALLATFVTDRAGLLRFAGDVLPVTDDRPAIEYAGWVERGVLNRVLPDLYGQRRDPPVNGADAAFQTAVQAQRAELDTFYRAGLSAYAGGRAGWAREMRALSEAGVDDNPYFRWFMGAQR